MSLSKKAARNRRWRKNNPDKTREYTRNWRNKNRKRVRAYAREYQRKRRHANIEETRAYARAYRANNPEAYHAYDLKAKYGIELDEFAKMNKAQRKCCAICRGLQKPKHRSLCVDHCHRTGKIRGLLCYSCNLAIGIFKDNWRLFAKAAKYLKGTK